MTLNKVVAKRVKWNGVCAKVPCLGLRRVPFILFTSLPPRTTQVHTYVCLCMYDPGLLWTRNLEVQPYREFSAENDIIMSLRTHDGEFLSPLSRPSPLTLKARNLSDQGRPSQSPT
jgi:hypothetical protein